MFEDIEVGIHVYLSKKDVDKVVNESEKLGEKVKESTEPSKESGKLFDGIIKKTKLFAFSLLTVRGVWFALRKSMTSYLAQNDALKNKMDELYYSIGSLFAPILQGMLVVIEEIVNFVDYFVKKLGFAGINMANFNKSAKEAKKTLLGIDEINNLTSNTSSSSATTELDFDDTKLRKRVKGFLDWLKALVETSITFKVLTNLFNGNELSFDDWSNAITTGLGAIGLGFGLASLGFGSAGFIVGLLGVTEITWGVINLLKNDKKLTKDDWKTVLWGGLASAASGLAFATFGFTGGAFALGLTGVITIMWAINHIIGDGSSPSLTNYEKKYAEEVASKTTTTVKSNVNQTPNRKGGMVMAQFATGTNYVPNDMVAMIHEGEAVVPKKYNNADLYGNVSAEQLNLLSAIYELVDDIKNKDTTIELDGEKVANKINSINEQNTLRNGVKAFAIAR